MNNNREVIVRDLVKNVIDKYNLDGDISLVNNSNVIACAGDDISFWLRLLPSTDNKFRVEISSIVIEESKRKRGIFTSLYKTLESCEAVNFVIITSVCSDEMRSWCESNGLVRDAYFNYV